MNTKDIIFDYLEKQTKSLSDNNFSLMTTGVIAEELHISRSLTSQYLNELFSEGKVIKILSRPVYFLDRKTLQKKYKSHELQSEYLSVKELMEEVHNKDGVDVFEEVIGHDGSLIQVIQQIKSALMYPTRGLPIILQGKPGSGKRYIANIIHQFCIDNKLIAADQIIYHLNLSDDTLDLDETLFGSDSISGLLEQKDIGVLYFGQGDHFDKNIQYKLANIIRDNYYLKDKKIIKVNCRFVFGVEKDLNDYFDYSLIQSIPMICGVPNFDQRGPNEKEQFIKFFQEEQSKLGEKVWISYKLLQILLQLKFDQDINKLKKCITGICATALSDSKDGIIKCHVYHLPDEHLEYSSVENNLEIESMIEIDSYEVNQSNSKIVLLFQSLVDSYHDFLSNSLSYSDMLLKNYEYMRNYYDLLIFEHTYSQKQINGLEKVIDEVFELKKMQGRINLPSNCSFVLSRMLLSSSQDRANVEKWMVDNHQVISSFLEFLNEKMNDVYMISQEISKMIYQVTELSLTDFNIIFLMLNIYFYNDNIHYRDTASIIVSHGYSTASSIADAANQLLEEHIFDAFDMPLDSSSTEIIAKVNDYISTHSHYKNLILLVDMGSLELIGEKVIGDINVGVINNISTSIALQIGSLVRSEKPLNEILEQASRDAVVTYKILNRAKKERAILFISDAGISVSDRMVNLFKQSLPKSIDLRFISYEINELLTNGLEDQIFSKFEVVLMVKPYSLPIEGIRSVSLEDIVSFKDISIVDDAFEPFLNSSELEAFNRNLLKNFSLQNVMKNLTILNASKLLDFVSESTLSLERKNKWKLQNKTIIGIYIHVCFLIERLVTKTPIDNYANVQEFESTQKEFIRDVNESFGAMLSHYNVQLPISEIALLYDYIVNDKIRKREESDLF